MIRSSSTGFNAVVDAFGVKEGFTERRHILIATGDTLAPQMAGPAIRAWQIACALCREHDVELVTTIECRDISHPDFRVRKVTDHELNELVAWSDVTIFQGYLMNQHPALRDTNKIVIADIYDPFHLEQLEQARDAGEAGPALIVRAATEVLNEQLTRGRPLPVREPQATRLLARSARRGRPGQPGHVRRRREHGRAREGRAVRGQRRRRRATPVRC